MRTRGRRRLDVIMLGLGAVAGGGIVAIGGLVGDAERVTQMWVGAELSTEGSSTVREVIDYDFGIAIDKHGIFRDIPGLSLESPGRRRIGQRPRRHRRPRRPSTSPGSPGSNLKIGDANTTISGRHRYRISYSLPRSELLDSSDQISWDAVGTEWSVPVGRAEVHVVAPWGFEDLTCSKGSSGSTGGCTLRQVEPGHLVAEIDGLKKGQGITVTAARGAALTAAPRRPGPARVRPAGSGRRAGHARGRRVGGRARHRLVHLQARTPLRARAGGRRRRGRCSLGGRWWPHRARCASTRPSWPRWPPPSSRPRRS